MNFDWLFFRLKRKLQKRRLLKEDRRRKINKEDEFKKDYEKYHKRLIKELSNGIDRYRPQLVENLTEEEQQEEFI